MAKGYNGYLIPPNEKANLIRIFRPSFEKIYLHHITHEFGITEKLPPNYTEAVVVGLAKNENGIEALVVKIGNSTKRPDGKTYHITMSLIPGKFKPNDSNKLIAELGYQEVSPIIITVEPSFFKLWKWLQ